MGVLQINGRFPKCAGQLVALRIFFGTAARGTLQDVKTSRLFKL